MYHLFSALSLHLLYFLISRNSIWLHLIYIQFNFLIKFFISSIFKKHYCNTWTPICFCFFSSWFSLIIWSAIFIRSGKFSWIQTLFIKTANFGVNIFFQIEFNILLAWIRVLENFFDLINLVLIFARGAFFRCSLTLIFFFFPSLGQGSYSYGS